MLLKTGLATDPRETAIIVQWSLQSQIPTPTSGSLNKQTTWDRPSDFQGDQQPVSLRPKPLPSGMHKCSVIVKHANNCLHVLPVGSCGLRLDDDTARIIIGLRLGACNCERHLCPRGEPVLEYGLVDYLANSTQVAFHAILCSMMYSKCYSNRNLFSLYMKYFEYFHILPAFPPIAKVSLLLFLLLLILLVKHIL